MSHIRLHEPLSRRAIARNLEMSPTTVSAAVEDLMGRGLVRALGEGKSTGGRRPILLEINPEGGLVVAVDIASSAQERRVRAAAFDLQNRIVLELTRPHMLVGNKAMLGAIQGIIADLLESPELGRIPTLTIGISVPGVVDAQAGSVVYTGIETKDLPLGSALRETFLASVIIQNSEDAAALGEFHNASDHESNSLLYLSVGAGLGAGLVVAGQIYQPERKSIGEIGHMTVKADGPQCHCGNYGCLSTLVSSEAIVERIQAALVQGYRPQTGVLKGSPIQAVDIPLILDAAEMGEMLCEDILQEAAQWMGIAVASTINILNPGIIVFGGELYETGDYFFGLTRDVAMLRSFPEYFEDTQLKRSALGRNAGLRGIGILALEELFRVSIQSQ
ncbi:MAG: ROK family transcriptional regulator [Chloroflexi bacterium]|nr:ROK family transcriptional regulator [Chloroflexota bacterium]